MAREGMRKRRGNSQPSGNGNGSAPLMMKSAFLTVRIVGALIVLYAAWSFFVIFNTDSRRALHVNEPLSLTNLERAAKLTDIQHCMNDTLPPMMIPRTIGSPGHEAVRKYIAQELEFAGFQVELNRFTAQTPHGERSFTNIAHSHGTVATLDPAESHRIILAAHYESKWFERGSPDYGFIGATDSAVPCAILLDLVKTLGPALRQRSKALGSTIQIVFFDGEEAFQEWNERDSIYGARHLAELWEKKIKPAQHGKESRHRNYLSDIEVFVLLDLIGQKQPHFLPLQRSTRKQFAKLVELEERLQRQELIHPKQVPYFDGVYKGQMPRIEDDHLPFQKRSVPILHMISVPFPPGWHTIKDNAELLDEKTIEDMLTILRAYVAEYLLLDLGV